MKKLQLRKIIKEELLNEKQTTKTIKYPTDKGTLHIEIEENTDGIVVDVIFNKIDLTTTNIKFPTGDVSIKHRKKRVKIK